jgi:hypothetical protein
LGATAPVSAMLKPTLIGSAARAGAVAHGEKAVARGKRGAEYGASHEHQAISSRPSRADGTH